MFFNGTEINKFEAKDSEIVATPLCLENISKEWSVDNMKKTGFKGYVYNFSVDYHSTGVYDDLKLLALKVIILYFILSALNQVNIVAIAIILMIFMQKLVFLIL